MISQLKKYILFISNPVFLTEMRLRKALEGVLQPLVATVGQCLDVGCGSRPYEHLFSQGSYVGVDVKSSGRPNDMKQPDYYYDGIILPFSDNAFDMVMSTQVLEHVPNPSKVLNEMARVCKKNGSVVISLPFVYPEHEEPFDFFRFTSFGIKQLAKEAGLEITSMQKDSTAIETMAILLNVYIMHNLLPNIKGFGRVYGAVICLPIQLMAMLLSKVLPDKGQLYLNLVVHAKKI